MPEQKHIVVVDDCCIVRDAISTYLAQEGFAVTCAETGAELRALVTASAPDLVIVDLKLPDEDGFALTRFLRATCGCGIIMLTGKTDPTDRVVALEIGADDFIAKPYDPRELLARIRAVLRRAANNLASGRMANVHRLDFGQWQFDVHGRTVSGHGRTAELTTAEFNLLNELAKRPGDVLTREHLLAVVYERPWDYYDRSIDVLVTRLRRKLESVNAGRSGVKSVRGSGYLFSEVNSIST